VNRKQQAAELRRTWKVYEPREPGKPFTRRDLEDADERERAAARESQLADGAAQVPMPE
jgi:hypothetical protein